MSSPMTLTCRSCRWSWGPVGVRPFVPDGPQQLFLVCGSCARPQARTLEPSAERDSLSCSACGAPELRPLSHCPRCDAQDLSWGPFMP